MSVKKYILNSMIWRFIGPIYYKYIRSSYDNYIGPFYYRIENLVCRTRYRSKNKINPFDVPIIINNYNRLSYLLSLINSLEIRGYKNIYIIDNDSTYPPLLEFYDKCKYKVFRLNKNIGFCSIWKTNIYSRFKHSYYVYTDSDMEIHKDCPDDFMEYFIKILNKYPLCQKVGFGIKIDDIPDCYKMKDEVIEHEKKFWIKKLDDNLFDATIDTTFALYRPYSKGPANVLRLNIRTGFPYLIKHLPWYVDSTNLSAEEKYYINNTRKSTFWTIRSKDLQN